jgi:hypothetical protein
LVLGQVRRRVWVGVIAEAHCMQRIKPLSGAGVRARASLPRRLAFAARTSWTRSCRRRAVAASANHRP